MDRNLELLLQRGVAALEKLAEDPVVQIEGGPPICPHCQTLNPNIEISEDKSSGEFASFIIQPQCGHCHKPFFAIPLEWATFTSQEEARVELQKRVEIFNAGTNGR